jgi:hypothetical protein
MVSDIKLLREKIDPSNSSVNLGSTVRESSDLYAKVIIQSSDRWRVILCSQGLQWIIQKKESSHAGPWRAEKYVTSRSALIRACGTLGLLSDPATEAVLYALPDYVSQLAKK